MEAGAPIGEDQEGKNRELLRKVMTDGVQVHLWVLQSLTIKARAFLAVGAIVAGILIAGLGSAVGLLASDPGAPGFLWRLPTWALVILGSCGVGSITAILFSIYFSLCALRTITVSSISYEPFTSDGENMDWEKLRRWVGMPEEEIYKHVHSLYFDSMKSLKRYNSRIADHTNRGKAFLFGGLCAGFAVSVTTLALSLVMGVPSV